MDNSRIVRPSHASNQEAAQDQPAADMMEDTAVVADTAEATVVEEWEWAWGPVDVRSTSPTFVLTPNPPMRLTDNTCAASIPGWLAGS